ncbi:MAG: DciA family protein [Sphingomonas sp.]|uniref:DUF721 domain-containing protein n=1 Tax=Sphingomonas sp. TaxID=28214 RepID=UPI0035A87A9F|nr:DciA family protein [Sphingomonas sp.]
MGGTMSKSGVRAPRPKNATPTAEAKRGGPARAVADLLPDVGGAAFRRFGFVQSAVVSRWAEIVGPKFAAVSAPESIKFPHGKRAEGTLALVVRGAHGPMMQHIAPEIIERVNRFFGYEAIARVAIRQGDVPLTPSRKPPPSIRPVPIELGDSLRAIADPEFKAVLEALAAGVAATRGPPIIETPERAE